VNTSVPGDYVSLDALKLAAGLGLSPVSANLILLGLAAASGKLFCPHQALASLIPEIAPTRFREANLKAFLAGVQSATP
jgi:Pyruvate/2-oxoacid:ferredoxin oxidoreductase gamma subunit